MDNVCFGQLHFISAFVRVFCPLFVFFCRTSHYVSSTMHYVYFSNTKIVNISFASTWIFCILKIEFINIWLWCVCVHVDDSLLNFKRPHCCWFSNTFGVEMNNEVMILSHCMLNGHVKCQNWKAFNFVRNAMWCVHITILRVYLAL